MSTRSLTTHESALLKRLLDAEFPGRQELISQLEAVLAEQVDSCGSIKFQVVSATIAPVMRRVPVEAQHHCGDGIYAHALLHVLAGKLHELEFYKDDGSDMLSMPAVDQWEVLVLG